ncbi:prostate stem cell antigen [Castor canadensis]|uniref:Prostate stem cell antigen n=1 Tax=Castor canadensis TaxID=51338 RepID=A0A8B7TZ10_CASCN
MKAVLLALLAIGLALQPGDALQCYTCTAEMSNKNCQNVKNCTVADTTCWTSRVSAVGFVTVISKGCSSNCEEEAENYYVGKKNVTCCDTDLCNFNGAHTLQPATTLGLLSMLGGLLLWGPTQL